MKKTLLVILAALAQPAYGEEEKKTGTKMDLQGVFKTTDTCAENSDCYMCTMSSCKWDGATCSGAPADLTFEFLREKHEQCNDPLDICSNKEKTQLDCEKDHCESEFDGYDEQLFSYKSDKGDVTIPKGYFCFNKFEINQEYKPVYYWNRTEPVKEAGEAHDSAKAEPRSEMMFLEEYYLQKKKPEQIYWQQKMESF